MTDLTYLPLPSSVTIDRSDIHGLGLWAVEEIKEGTEIGMSHFYWGETLHRTPLGGFINHAEQPNAKINLVTDGVRALTIEKAVKKGEEITVFYVLY